MKGRNKIKKRDEGGNKRRSLGRKKREVGVTEDFQWVNNLLSFKLTLERDLALSLHGNESEGEKGGKEQVRTKLKRESFKP